jgi:periplasmic divalent cation tolerance protein
VTGYCQVSTAVDSAAAAENLAATLVGDRLAACVQVIGPVQSTYRWNGAVESATEWICLAKTTEERLPAVFDTIRARHSYEQPEIVATPIGAGDPGYLAWVRRETTP